MSNDKQHSPARAGSPPRGTTTSFALASGSGSWPSSAPAGHALRRSMTADESRRRPTLPHLSSAESPFASHRGESPIYGRRRASSSFSDYSIPEARRTLRESTADLLNPSGARYDSAHQTSSRWASLPLAFALLPALGGILFQNGSAMITDVMLLGLVFIFLRYTVTQPWQWYHAAQELRIRQEAELEAVFEDESEGEAYGNMEAWTGTLEDVPEEDSPRMGRQIPEGSTQDNGNGKEEAMPENKEKSSRTRSQEAALCELHVHEVLALLSCFVCPVLGGYLLHTIRAQLSRPSEGLLTNFNIGIFLLAAEIHPVSHALKLVQARTLHLQKIVQSTPHNRSAPALTAAQLDEMTMRLEQLEMRAASGEPGGAQNANAESSTIARGRQEAVMIREVRNAVQPEIDALNRAVRRYEKKAMVLALQTEARLGAVDTRLNDAISLAAAAVKNSRAPSSFGSFLGWITEWVCYVVISPFFTIANIMMLPFRTLMGLFSRKKGKDGRGGHGRSARSGKSSMMPGGSGSDKDRYRDRDRDRMPSRLSKR